MTTTHQPTVWVTQPSKRGDRMLKPQKVLWSGTTGENLHWLISQHPDAFYYYEDEAEHFEPEEFKPTDYVVKVDGSVGDFVYLHVPTGEALLVTPGWTRPKVETVARGYGATECPCTCGAEHPWTMGPHHADDCPMLIRRRNLDWWTEHQYVSLETLLWLAQEHHGGVLDPIRGR